MKSFKDYGLPKELLHSLDKVGYSQPTEIQQKAIPLVLKHKDVLASSKTGSGKTAAFVIPVLAKILHDHKKNYCLIIAPTRELVVQIATAIKSLSSKGIRSTSVFGGVDMKKQILDLKRNPNIIIATPGRLNDHIRRGTVKLGQFNHVVLDEFDRMLDMGFKDEIKIIFSNLAKNKQTLMFSATDSPEIIKLARNHLSDNYETIRVISKTKNNVNIKQDFTLVNRSNKFEVLVKEIANKKGSILVFVNTKKGADSLQGMLHVHGYKTRAIHGDLRQRERDRVIKQFRLKSYQVLIATDVVARGIDIDHIEYVINYDFPKFTEDYVHRIGRTGRMNAKGSALSFVSNEDQVSYKKTISTLDLENVLPFPKKPSNKKKNRRVRYKRRPRAS